VTTGGVLSIIHHFPAGSRLQSPNPLLVYQGGLVGTTRGASIGRKGPTIAATVFHAQPGSTVIWCQVGPNPGLVPNSLIIGADGDLYGTTDVVLGSGSETIFKISKTKPHTLTELYTFPTSGSGGDDPAAGLVLAQDGNYYGTTLANTAPGLGGTIFQMTPSAQVTFIYSFAANISPDSSLIQDQNGNFYGAADSISGGLVFKMTPSFEVTVLHSFGQGTDGIFPSGLVIGPNGDLYGVAGSGGTNGSGNVFELSTDGTSYTVLHNFRDGSVPNDGAGPNGPLCLGSDNNLYGTTEGGGSANDGTVFKIAP
jgi:uncharacterized repeat protein (TIGR03803 family)